MENQSIVHVNSLKCYALIDSGSMASTVSDHVLKLMKPVPVAKNLEEFQLSVSVAGGSKLPYSGYVEVEVHIPLFRMILFVFLCWLFRSLILVTEFLL